MSAIVPVFRDSGFGAEATQALGKAYDIACLSLHPSGQPPVVQEILTKKIIEVAQRGERDPDRLASIALANLGPLHCEITRRFGLYPISSCRPPMRRRSSRSFGTSPSRPISTVPFPRFSRSGCSSSCRASAKSVSASFATADFWWATAIHRAIIGAVAVDRTQRAG